VDNLKIILRNYRGTIFYFFLSFTGDIFVSNTSSQSSYTKAEPKTLVASTDAKKFEIQRFYVKKQLADVSYAPSVFQQEGKPETTVEMKIDHTKISEVLFEVGLTFQISMKLQQQTALRLEVQQAALFKIEGYIPEEEEFLLNAFCPNILHPYARKIVADLSFNAGFLPITLPPINFDQAYQARQKNRVKKENIEVVQENSVFV
jgi:preprotein translocase subunit SecB